MRREQEREKEIEREGLYTSRGMFEEESKHKYEKAGSTYYTMNQIIWENAMATYSHIS